MKRENFKTVKEIGSFLGYDLTRDQVSLKGRYKTKPISWPDLAIGLYDRLTGRQAEISYEFENLHVKIPSDTTENAQHAEWILDGCIKIKTRDTSKDPK